MNDEELQAVFDSKAEEYRQSGMHIISVPAVADLSIITRNFCKRHIDLVGAFIKCEYAPCIKVIEMTIQESIIARVAYTLGKEVGTYAASSRDQALAIERFVLQYKPDRPCHYRLECVLHDRCPQDPVCKSYATSR